MPKLYKALSTYEGMIIIMEKLKTLELLCGAYGPSGIENEVTDIIKSELKPYSDFTDIDCCGNLTAHFAGGGRKARVLLSAHTDESSLMIKSIDEAGYLSFDALGELDMRYLYGKRVTVGGERGKLSGIICSKPLHLLSRSERDKVPDAENLYIDIGAADRKEAAELVSPGDCAVFERQFSAIGGAVVSKALADRFTAFAVIEAFKKLNSKMISMDYDIYAVFSSKSRVGYSTAASAAEKIKPDIILSLSASEISGVGNERASVYLPYRSRRIVYDRTLLRKLSGVNCENICLKNSCCEDISETVYGDDAEDTANNGGASYITGAEKLCMEIPQSNGMDEDVLLQRVCGGTRICSIVAPCSAPDTGSAIMRQKTIAEYTEFLVHALSDVQF